VDPKAPIEDGEAGLIWVGFSASAREKRMPFINTFERSALEKGLLRGIEACLRIKFGAEGLELMPEIREIRDHKVLEKILSRIRTSASPDDLRRVWTRKRPSKPTESK
jgi:hypothetical protein